LITDDKEHAVIVRFYDYAKKFWTKKPQDLAPLYALEEELEAAIEKSGAGELDGHDIATDGSNGMIVMYGPDADLLFAVVEPVLCRSPIAQGANVTLKYGAPCALDVAEKCIEIKAPAVDVFR
jgi:hypothetical protein